MVYNSEKNNIKSYRSANPHSLHESENFILPKIPYFIPKANNQFNCSKENLDFGGRYRILFHLTSTSLEISILLALFGIKTICWALNYSNDGFPRNIYIGPRKLVLLRVFLLYIFKEQINDYPRTVHPFFFRAVQSTE